MKNINQLRICRMVLLVFCFGFCQLQTAMAECEECPEVTLELVINGTDVSNYFFLQFNNGEIVNQTLDVTITHVLTTSGCTFPSFTIPIDIDNNGYGKTLLDHIPFSCLNGGTTFMLSFNDSTCDYDGESGEGVNELTGCNGISLEEPPPPPPPITDCPDCPELNYNNGVLTLTYPQIYAYSGEEINISCGSFTAIRNNINENAQVIVTIPLNFQQCFAESPISISMYGDKKCKYESLQLIDCQIPDPICEECPHINVYRPTSIPYIAFQFHENTSSPLEISILCNGTQFATYSLNLDSSGFGILNINNYSCNGVTDEFSFTVAGDFTCSYKQNYFGLGVNGSLETLVECSPPIISNTCETCPWIVNSGETNNYYYVNLNTYNSTVPQNENIFVICNGEILEPFQFFFDDNNIGFQISNNFSTTCFEDKNFTIVFDNGQVCSFNNNQNAYSCHLIEEVEECKECPDIEYDPKVKDLNFYFPASSPSAEPVILSCHNQVIGTFDPTIQNTSHWTISLDLNDCIETLGLTISIGDLECSYIGSLVEDCGDTPPIDEDCDFITICEEELTEFVLNYPGTGCKKWESACNTWDNIYRYGNVSIGNPPNVPNGYKLALEKGMITDQVKVELCGTGGWCDYVFEESYPLLLLADIECHIEENGHLPNTTTQRQVMEEKGIEVRSVMLNHQEKVEEIFLHLIEMDESLNKIEQEIARLEKENQQLKRKLK